jgi:hypothetical protein
LLIVPSPAAVGAFKALHMPEHVVEAELLMDDAARELLKPCSPLSVEDLGDRETALGEYARADKTVSSNPERMGSYLRSLS